MNSLDWREAISKLKDRINEPSALIGYDADRDVLVITFETDERRDFTEWVKPIACSGYLTQVHILSIRNGLTRTIKGPDPLRESA